VSAKGRGPSSGGPEDYYTTPSWCVRRLLEEWRPARSGGIWVEPGAGNGAIIRATDAFPGNRPGRWRAYEIREEERQALEGLCATTIGNFLHLQEEPSEEVTVVLGNPPYNQAFDFIRQAHLLFPRAEIVYLLRVAFTASQERYDFMRSHMPDEFKLPDRPSFTGEGGGDSADYAWMRWPADWIRRDGYTRMLARTPLEERQRDRGHHVVVTNPQAGLFG
jgi:hypothetical protein